MIIINAKMEIDPLIKQIEYFIDVAMEESAKDVATSLQVVMKDTLSKGIRENSGNESGNLSDSILVKPGGSIVGYYRWDVIVDMTRAPYAMWIEFGANAPFGLPYSKTSKENNPFVNSKFKGYHYLTATTDEFANSGIANAIVGAKITKILKEKYN